MLKSLAVLGFLFVGVAQGQRASPVRAELYTPQNPRSPRAVNLNDANSLKQAGFNPQRPTKVLINGYGGTSRSAPIPILRDAWMQTGAYNILAFDYSADFSPIYYRTAAKAPAIGAQIANFLDRAVNVGLRLGDVEINAISLGAHIAGYIGKQVRSGNISKIVALDAAGPGFQSNGLSSTDASYVEAIHTGGGVLGTTRRLGHADFYVNGGISQPGCVGSVCSHLRATNYFSNAIRGTKYPSYRCRDVQSATRNQCGSTLSGISLGSSSNAQTARGVYNTPIRG